MTHLVLSCRAGLGLRGEGELPPAPGSLPREEQHAQGTEARTMCVFALPAADLTHNRLHSCRPHALVQQQGQAIDHRGLRGGSVVRDRSPSLQRLERHSCVLLLLKVVSCRRPRPSSHTMTVPISARHWLEMIDLLGENAPLVKNDSPAVRQNNDDMAREPPPCPHVRQTSRCAV